MNLLDNCLNKAAEAKKFHFWMFFAILLILTCTTVYWHPPLAGHDSFFHQMRFDALTEALRDGRFPVYIDYSAVNGYGYLTNAFYCDILLIPFAVLAIYTNTIFAYQVMLVSITILTGLIMYYAVNSIFKNAYISSISAVLYTFSYYRFLDIYARGALGEAISFMFVPLIFLGLYHIIKGDYRKWYIIAIGFSLMIFSHVISSILTFITVIIILAVYHKSLIKEPKRVAYLFLAGIVTSIITAYYLYPILEQMSSAKFYYETKPIMMFPNNTTGAFQIIKGLFSGIIYKDAFLPGIGFILVWAVSLRIFISGKSKVLRAMDVCLIIGIAFVCAASIYFPWKVFPFNKFSFIQFPWRLYELTTFFFALAGAYYIFRLAKTRINAFAGLIFILFLTAIMISYNGIHFIGHHGDNTLKKDIQNSYFLQGAEYLPNKFPSIWYVEVRGSIIDSENTDTQTTDLKTEKGITSFNATINNPDILELPLIYYKGYSASVDGENIPIQVSNAGLIELPIDKSGEIKVIYSGTFIQKISPYISLISIIALCIYIFINRRKRIPKSKENA